MRFTPGVASAVVLSWFLGQSGVAGEAEVGRDPTVAPTVDLQQEQEAAEQREEDEGFTVHGTGYLVVQQPFTAGPAFNMFLAQGELRFTRGTFGAFATPRLRVAPSGGGDIDRAYLFFQQAYGYAKHPWGEVKVGKVYQRFGRLWDYGFYGPLLANDDVKLQPDLGVAAEGAPNLLPNLDLEYAAQFFAVDGRALSLRNDRMFEGSHARRRNIAVLRAAPVYHFNSDTSLALGVSGSRHEATLERHTVLRGALDVDATYGPFNAFAEAGRQTHGDWASANGHCDAHTYVWTGAGYKTDWVHLRYHYNMIRYDSGVVDQLHQPGVEFTITENWGAMAELAWWSTTGKPNKYRERAVYLVGTGRF